MSTAFLFPGQGSQHVGMGLELYRSEPTSRAVFDQADELFGESLSKLCFEGPEERLTDTAVQQPALLATSIATLRAMEVYGMSQPDYFAGHSLGEFSALIAAGSLRFEDGFNLVKQRSKFMKEAGIEKPGAMAAILGLEPQTIQSICAEATSQTEGLLQIANDNCPGQIVISGDRSAVEAAVTLAERQGARKIIRLPISIAAHSPLMDGAAKKFSELLKDADIRTPQVPVVGNVSAVPLSTPEEIREELSLQLTSPVMWHDSMRYLLDRGVNSFYEVGAGSVLLGLMKRIDRNAQRIKWTLPA